VIVLRLGGTLNLLITKTGQSASYASRFIMPRLTD
jgi:hypothetical protein